jgi:hypothetical protein
MLDKVCAYACNYARNGIVHQFFFNNDQVCHSNHIEIEYQQKN